MPQDLPSDPRTELATTLATSGLPLLARAVAAGAIGGSGVHAVLDCLSALAADGHDADALAEAEEFLTSIAAATDPAHVAQVLRVHCDEVLRPHLAADDEDEDEAWTDNLATDDLATDAATAHLGSEHTSPTGEPLARSLVPGRRGATRVRRLVRRRRPARRVALGRPGVRLDPRPRPGRAVAMASPAAAIRRSGGRVGRAPPRGARPCDRCAARAPTPARPTPRRPDRPTVPPAPRNRSSGRTRIRA